MPPTAGLRERKKQRTRDTIVRKAMALFRKRGFDATTVADIAAAADIAPRTFFAYFETKEAVVFHDFDAIRDRFAERLRARSADETTFDALRAWVVEWLEEEDLLSPQHEARHELVRTTPALQARERDNQAAFGAIIAESVAGELGVPVDSLRPRMVGAAAVSALAALDHADAAALEDPVAVVDEALAFLQGGLDVLRRRPAPSS
ncbi:MAG TPA: TetR family transcriptional regulator [Solirubrobacteraceae bacterium]|jgi:AcrR family transcriptional regulator